MRLKCNIIVVVVCFCTLQFFPGFSFSQTHAHENGIFFYQLTTAQGLSDNYVNGMCIDKGGNLWITTGEGLNMFNGKTVVKFFTEDYPQLQNDYTAQVVCDDQNRLWVLTKYGNVTMIDENRRFHRIALYNHGTVNRTRWILKTKQPGIILFTKDGFYCFSSDKDISGEDSITVKSFSKLVIKGIDSLIAKSYLQTEPYDDNSYIFNVNEEFVKVNFKERRIEKRFPFSFLQILTKWGPDDVLVIDRFDLRLRSINLGSNAVTFPLQGIRDQFGDSIKTRITNAKRINDDHLMLTTLKGGLYIFNITTHKLFNYTHNAADPSTIVNNSPNVIATDSSGWVFIGATPNGISYYKRNAVIGQQSVFLDKLGNSFDGYINAIETKDNDTYYIGCSDYLMEWTRSVNTTNFLNYAIEKGRLTRYNEGISSIAFDKLGRMWVAVGTRGVFILDRNKKPFKHMENDSGKSNAIPAGIVTHMQMQPDGFMWLTASQGMCRVNVNTLEVDNFKQTPLFALHKVHCYRSFFPDDDNVWIATGGKGLWHYYFPTQTLTNYTTSNGLAANEVFAINKDRLGNLYVGTSLGMNIFLHNGKLKTVTDKDGLLNKRAEALILDKQNRMWIGNDVGLACFDIKDSSLKVFDERYGLSVQGFRIGSYHQNSDDELIWGTERGLQYFYPEDLLQQKVSVPTFINRVETRNVVSDLTQDAALDLSPLDNYVSFYFTSIDYSKHLRTFYEYKLEGVDDKWIKVVDQNFVRYSSLDPGKYTFKVRASNDNIVWEEAKNKVIISIAKPLVQRTWFRLLGILIALALIWFVINFYRRKQIEQQEELETQMVINYFASRINSYQILDDILWDVARNCISKLKFEDCVIYLLDEERNVLVQKAAYGPKLARDFTISEPIEIPVGKGIVGAVAESGKPELIANTELDPRYIVDDARRYSEVTVPIIADHRVIGVIDSEHSKKNFFNQKHLNILSTIALLCANQMQRAKAEEEKQKAKIESLENKQKVAESRLQSLRLQMNPHFLFNALNSIQQMILANEELVATRFLSRFSKLLRTILIHSDKETVTLKEELEILNLYIELEARRFKDSFRYKIECDNEIDEDEIKIPTLLIQPFVENAIWHGLMHQEGDRSLKIRFSEQDDFLRCIIEDNGVGRKKSEETKKANGQDKGHISKGIKVSLERLKTLHNRQGHEGSLAITDLHDENGNAAGTRIEINFPIQN